MDKDIKEALERAAAHFEERADYITEDIAKPDERSGAAEMWRHMASESRDIATKLRTLASQPAGPDVRGALEFAADDFEAMAKDEKDYAKRAREEGDEDRARENIGSWLAYDMCAQRIRSELRTALSAPDGSQYTSLLKQAEHELTNAPVFVDRDKAAKSIVKAGELIARARVALSAPDGWRDMKQDPPPKDGTFIIVTDDSGTWPDHVRWADGAWRHYPSEVIYDPEPAYWMSATELTRYLPTPPKGDD